MTADPMGQPSDPGSDDEQVLLREAISVMLMALTMGAILGAVLGAVPIVVFAVLTGGYIALGGLRVRSR
jgi:uncharacterized RDD family membrane protein YckC